MSVWAWQSYYSTRREPKHTSSTRKAVALIQAAIDIGEKYGACHIVLADLNLELSHLRWCLQQPHITPAGRTAMEVMAAMTMRERAIAMAAVEGAEWALWTDQEWAEFDHD